MNTDRPQYGLDAPHVLITLVTISLLFDIGAILSILKLPAPWSWVFFGYSLSISLSFACVIFWMLLGITTKKPKIAIQMIKDLELKGTEKLLDLGCGSGLFLCTAAKDLPQGEAHGVDLWLKKDHSNNSKKTTLKNIEKEGVTDRVTLHTADVSHLPFEDNTFDVVISSLCFHNIKDKLGKEQALKEMLRVLKPEGKFAIADIFSTKKYIEYLTAQGIDVQCSAAIYSYFPPIRIIKGTKS